MHFRDDKLILMIGTFIIGLNLLVFAYYIPIIVTKRQAEEQIGSLASIEENVDVLSVSTLNPKVRVAFVGDIMFDRYIRQIGEKHGYSYILEDTGTLFDGVDYVVGNLEGPVTDFDSVSMGTEEGSAENYIFTMDKKALEALYDAGIKVLNIGNNHIGNFGEDGIISTSYYLDLYRFGYFGDLNEIDGFSKQPFVIDKGSYRVNIFNYNQFGGMSQEELSALINGYSGDDDVNIVYTHWGEEYIGTAPDYVRDTAEKLVDSGADLIIGSHPHVVQNVDSYKGKKIYYSLGNFIMDQYFDENVRKGLVVFADVSPENIETSTRFVHLEENGKTSLLEK